MDEMIRHGVDRESFAIHIARSNHARRIRVIKSLLAQEPGKHFIAVTPRFIAATLAVARSSIARSG